MAVAPPETVGDLENLRQDALYKVGRNVVLFSNLEKLIRCTVQATQIYGTVDLNNPTELTLHLPHPEKSSLGTLMDQLCKNLFGPTDAKPPAQTSPTTAILFQRLTIEMTKAEQRAWKKNVLALITDRNQLIHGKLAEFDFDSVDQLNTLIETLDEQRGRLLSEIQSFQFLYQQLRTFRDETNEAIKSGALELQPVGVKSVT